MPYLALYRKYRPLTFDKLVGQEHIVRTLINQINDGRLGHAYLFTGTRGTGKTSCAKIFAKALNCLSPINGSPCGKCESCKALSDPSNIDIVEIDAASNNGVDEIRTLRENVQYPPVSCKYKVYIIDEVHMLTGAAFNALLKTLEEPPKHAIFILATTEVHKIPATILSRCMRFDFRLIYVETIASLISEIYDEIGKEYEKEAVFAIASAGEGSIRDALSIADIALSYTQSKLTYNDVMDILGSSNFDLLYDFVSAMLKGDAGQVLEITDKFCKLGKSMGVLIKDITKFLRDLIVIKTCNQPNSILLLPREKIEILSKLSSITSNERLVRVLEVFAEAETTLKYSNHPRIVFESVAIKGTRPDSDYDYDSLLARIKELENKIDGGFVSVNKENKVSNNEMLNNVEVKSVKLKKLEDFSLNEIKGFLLKGLRTIDNEMLWNIMQGVDIKVKSDSLLLETSSAVDERILANKESISCIEKALSDFMPFKISVSLSHEEKNLDKVDNEIDKVKKIFGEDIVIIKN